MRKYAEKRLMELRNELDMGQQQLGALEQRIADLRNTLFRISGAIQVLEDVLAHDATETNAETERRTPEAKAAAGASRPLS